MSRIESTLSEVGNRRAQSRGQIGVPSKRKRETGVVGISPRRRRIMRVTEIVPVTATIGVMGQTMRIIKGETGVRLSQGTKLQGRIRETASRDEGAFTGARSASVVGGGAMLPVIAQIKLPTI